MISDYVRYFRLRALSAALHQKPIGMVVGARLNYPFDEKHYEGLEWRHPGGLRQALPGQHPRLRFIPPACGGETTLVTLDNGGRAGQPAPPAHLPEREPKLLAVEPHDDSHLHIDVAEVLTGLRPRTRAWMDDVPPGVAERIVSNRLLGFDTE